MVAVVAVTGLVPACSRDSSDSPASPAATRAATVIVRVGEAGPIQAEVADARAERARGLMDRDQLPPGAGMVFVFPEPTTASFYMFRTRIPLSIAFVDHDRVVSVAEMTPCPSDNADDCDLYPAGGPYTLAVEAPGRHFTDAGVRPGDPVRIDGDLPTAAD